MLDAWLSRAEGGLLEGAGRSECPLPEDTLLIYPKARIPNGHPDLQCYLERLCPRRHANAATNSNPHATTGHYLAQPASPRHEAPVRRKDTAAQLTYLLSTALSRLPMARQQV